MKFLVKSEDENNVFAGCSPKTCSCYGATTNCSSQGNSCSPKICPVYCSSLMICIPPSPGMAQAKSISIIR